MFKTPLPLICIAGIIAALGNNYVFYHDIIFDKHGGVIQQGPYATLLVLFFLSITIGCLILLVMPVNVVSYFLDPAAIKNRRLGKIQEQLDNIQSHLDDQVKENEDLSEFVSDVRKEIKKIM